MLAPIATTTGHAVLGDGTAPGILLDLEDGRILAEEVTGRSFPVTDPTTWKSALSDVARAQHE